MASSLLVHKRINTTLAKAKELRKYVEPLITKAKSDTTHSRRVVFSYLQDKESVNALFNEVVDRVASRPGGYTRIIKLGTRLGDNAEMAMIELVDFNDLLIQEAEPKKAKTRRSRRGSKAKEEKSAPVAKTETEEKVEEVKIAEEEVKPETDKVVETKVEDAKAGIKENEVEPEVNEVKDDVEAKEDKKPAEIEAKKADAKKVEKNEDKLSDEVKAKTEESVEAPASKSKEDKNNEESKDSGEEKKKN